VTRATARPLRRVVVGLHGELVAEIRERTLTLRPLRTRRGGRAELVIPWESIYIRSFPVPRRRRTTRGLLR